MAGTRVVGTKGARSPVGGRPASRGNPVGRGAGVRVKPQPPVTRIYSHCEAKTKAGQPCRAPNVKGEPLCQGHKNQKEARK